MGLDTLDTKEYPLFQPLPTISEETRGIVFEELTGRTEGGNNPPSNLDQMFLQILTESRNRTETPAQRASSLTGRVFSDVNQVNPDLVKQIYEVLANRYELSGGKPHPQLMDSATIGMAVVLRAYDIETRHQLIEALGRVSGDDLGAVVNASIEENIPKLDPWASGPTILEEIINMPRIPEHQINLNFCLREASRNVTVHKEFFRGAISMYTILSRLWGRLIPQSGPTQPPT